MSSFSSVITGQVITNWWAHITYIQGCKQNTTIQNKHKHIKKQSIYEKPGRVEADEK